MKLGINPNSRSLLLCQSPRLCAARTVSNLIFRALSNSATSGGRPEPIPACRLNNYSGIELEETVDPNSGKLRLDSWISSRVDGVSRAQVQSSIRAGLVSVNGRIINKVVHPAPGNATGTLVNGILHHCCLPIGSSFPSHEELSDLDAASNDEMDHIEDDYSSTRDAAIRLGTVHRLDKGTSGLLLVAKYNPNSIGEEGNIYILNRELSVEDGEVEAARMGLNWAISNCQGPITLQMDCKNAVKCITDPNNEIAQEIQDKIQHIGGKVRHIYREENSAAHNLTTYALVQSIFKDYRSLHLLPKNVRGAILSDVDVSCTLIRLK